MTLSRRWVRGAVWFVLLMTGLVLARAQEVSGNISGTVVDAAGAVVGGATVTLTNTDRAYVERTLTTNKAGYYSATSLPLGTYSVTVAMKGFKTATETGIVLNASDELKVDEKLVVGAPTETVTIVADAARVNMENGQSSGLINGTQLRELILNNRNYEQFLAMQPGVSNGNATSDQVYIGVSNPLGSSNQVAYSVNGGRPTANNWTIDGADNVDRGANLTLLAYPSVDAIAEVQTLRGTYEAEYGRSASALVNVVTASGTNDLHGGAYEFFRNNIFNADNYFSKLTPPATPVPPLRYNDFGFKVGGPIVIPHLYNGKDKAFFYYSQEFRRVVTYAVATAYVPTTAEMAGNFTTEPGSALPVAVCTSAVAGACASGTSYATTLTTFDPTALAYIKDVYSKVAQPNSAADIAAGLDPHTVVNNIRNIANDTQEFARIDYALNKKTNLFYRYLHDSLPTQEGGGLFIGGGIPGVSTTSTKSPGTQHMGHATVAARPNLLFDMGYAFSSGAVVSTPIGEIASANSPDVNPGLPFVGTIGVIPSLSFSGIGPSISSDGIYRDYNRNHNGFGSATYIRGVHTLKFGVTYDHYQKDENATGTANQGQFSFNQSGTTPSSGELTTLGAAAPSQFEQEFAGFLIGNANGGFTQASEAPVANINENLIELYGQDDWRASRRLTVNLGVRYSYFGQPYDVNNELSNFDPATYNPYNLETISSNGNLCTMAGQTTSVTTFTATGVVTTYTLNNCPNINGLNAYQPNTVADPLNGIILGDPGLIAQESAEGSTAFPYVTPSGAPNINTHGSPWGLEVGHAEKHDFAPRFGFAYDVFGDGKTALRGGYGMAYDESPVSIYEQAIFDNPPYVQTNTYATATVSAVSGTTVLNLTPPSLRGSPLIYKTPYVQQFSLDIQQEITPTMMLDVGYVGEHGDHLQGVVDINDVQPGAFTKTSIGFAQQAGCSAFTSQNCEAPLNQIRPYLGYTAINDVQTIFNSNYNGLQVKFTKKFSGKSMIDANYTWSRGLTNAQNDYSTAPQNAYNLRAEYGPSVYNRNDVLLINGIWDLPWYRNQEGVVGEILGGWEFTGIYVVSSGLPLTATMSGGGTINYGGLTSIYNNQTSGGLANDAAGLGILGPSAASLRPNVVLNPSDGYGQVQLRKRLHWFNQTAFVAPSPSSFQVGNEQRNIMTGPGYNRFDVGVFRNFKLYRSVTFQLRGEGYNVLNHTNWGTVGTTATSSTFGTITATRDPRILQVGGKLNF
ncbi:MAG: carboxypeptidase-like regulatory domain-containing protein [Acidobacteriaceae bacterium]